MTGPLARMRCPVCDRLVPILRPGQDGKRRLRKHPDGKIPQGTCDASGQAITVTTHRL